MSIFQPIFNEIPSGRVTAAQAWLNFFCPQHAAAANPAYLHSAIKATQRTSEPPAEGSVMPILNKAALLPLACGIEMSF